MELIAYRIIQRHRFCSPDPFTSNPFFNIFNITYVTKVIIAATLSQTVTLSFFRFATFFFFRSILS